MYQILLRAIDLTADPVVIGFQNLCHAYMTKYLQQLPKQLLLSQLIREESRYPFMSNTLPVN